LAKLNIVGVGPGSADYVTPAAKKAVQQADVVVGSMRSIDLLRADIKGEAVVFTAKTLHDTLKHAAEALKSGKKVALLSVGDPGFSGLLHTVQECGLFQDNFEVIPGVSSVQACAACLKINWEGACLFTFHDGKVTAQDKKELLSCLKSGKTAIVLPDSKAFTPEIIADYLIKSGLDNKTPVYICENLTLPEEKVTSSSLGDMSVRSFGSLCIIVIKQ
jgi:cobalt-precorrin-7 (C5)-methyltransferase